MPRVKFERFVERTRPFAVSGIEAGSGEPLLCLSHPPFPVAAVFGGLLDVLAERHRVIALDFPAAAPSPPAEGPIFAVGFTLAIDDLCRRRGIEPACLVGAGLGSAVVADYAVTHGGAVRRVALLDPFLPGFHLRLPPPESGLVSPLAGMRLAWWKARTARALAGPLAVGPAMAALADRSRRDGYLSVLRALRPPRTAHGQRASVLHFCHLQAAALLVCGRRSPLVEAEPLAMMLRRMTDARVLALPTAARFPAIEAPAETAAALARFFAGEWPVPPGLPPDMDWSDDVEGDARIHYDADPHASGSD